MAELKSTNNPSSSEVPISLVHPSDEMNDNETLRRKRNIEEVDSTDPEGDADRIIHHRKRSRETDPTVVKATLDAASSPVAEEEVVPVDKNDEERVDRKEGEGAQLEGQESTEKAVQKGEIKGEEDQVGQQVEHTSNKVAQGCVEGTSTEGNVTDKTSLAVNPEAAHKSSAPADEDKKSTDNKQENVAGEVPKASSDSAQDSKHSAPSPFASVSSVSASNNFFIKPTPSSGPAAVSSPFGSFGGGSSSFGSSGLAWGFASSTPTTSTNQVNNSRFQAPKPFGAPASDEEAESDEEEDADNDSEDDALRAEAKRLAETQHTTGEEGEETIYKLEAKFFVLVKDSKGAPSWVERGNGVVKLNRSVTIPARADEAASNDGSVAGNETDHDTTPDSDAADSTDAAETTKAEPVKDAEEGKTAEALVEEGSEVVAAKANAADTADGIASPSEGDNETSQGDEATNESGESKVQASSAAAEQVPVTSKKAQPTVRARLLMRSHKALHVTMNCPLHKDLKYGDVKGGKPNGALFYFTWPQGAGKYDICLLKSAVPGNASELWDKVQDVLEEL